MPTACDEGVQFAYVLETDRDNPIETTPTFYFGSLTMRAHKLMNKRANEIDQLKNEDEMLDELCSIICKHLVGWENMKHPETGKSMGFNKKRLADLISMREGWELVNGIKRQGLGFDDQKNLSSPSTSSTGPYVKSVPDKKSAKTSRRRSNR